jgi:hypothetical protein
MVVWNILWISGIFLTIWYILCSFDTIFPVLVTRTKKNLATLGGSTGGKFIDVALHRPTVLKGN